MLLLSLVLTGLAWYYVRGTVEEQNQVRFDETVQATRAAVDRRTDAYLDALFGARGVFLASNAVEREEWESYVKGIETKTRLEGLQALGFARYVSARRAGGLSSRRPMKRGGRRCGRTSTPAGSVPPTFPSRSSRR